MPRKSKTEIFTVYSQIGEVVARAMADEGKLNLIEPAMIPASQLFDVDGKTPARCAIIVDREAYALFLQREKQLRA